MILEIELYFNIRGNEFVGRIRNVCVYVYVRMYVCIYICVGVIYLVGGVNKYIEELCFDYFFDLF